MKDPGIVVIGSQFTAPGRDGDFGWMIEQAKYDDVLFIFNDNEEQFLEHVRDPSSDFGCAAGGGNAVIRPYRCRTPPKSAGIPTGANGQGYQDLTATNQRTIDLAMTNIRQLIRTDRYGRIVYSSDESGSLGTGIFEVASSVKNYIVREISRLAD